MDKKGILPFFARRYDDPRILKNLFPRLPEDSPKWRAAIEAGEAIGRELMEQARGPIFNLIPATPKTEISGITVRRSVDHIGRNDPCPCGSGSKYKRCCFGKDQQRLQMSTDVAAKGARENEKLREARQKLQAKAAEVNRMKNDMEKLHAEIERREQKAADNAAKPTPAPAAPVDLEVLRDLREKVSTLKSELKERHDERAVLRRELNTTLNEVETLRENQSHAHGSPADHEDNDDHLVLPGPVGGSQPVRLIEFPKKFHHTLGRFPKQIARGTLTLLGRLAAGEPDAFQGVVRLKQRPDTLRARIGIDHRLLFRLETDAIHVIDLIPRQDLERRIKSL